MLKIVRAWKITKWRIFQKKRRVWKVVRVWKIAEKWRTFLEKRIMWKTVRIWTVTKKLTRWKVNSSNSWKGTPKYEIWRSKILLYFWVVKIWNNKKRNRWNGDKK